MEIQLILESRDQIGHTYFWPFITKKFSINEKIKIFCEFVSTCKELGCFINLFWRNGWFKNPEIWLAETILAYISGTITANKINFHYRTNSMKIIEKFFFESKKPSFWLISPILGAKAFTKNLALSHAQHDRAF